MNRLHIFVLLISLLLLGNNFVRDLQLEQRQLGDLRNRLVGARLQKDGLSPYFHKWKKGDGMRYYDLQSENSLIVSGSTSSPFFHTLLYPIAELPYKLASTLWIYLLYGLLLLSAWLAILLSKKNMLPLVCLITVGFTYTETWLDNIVTKQSYLFIPFFSMLVFYFLKRGKRANELLIAAGVFSVFLLLTRPNALFFFLPFIFIWNRYRLSARICFLIPFLAGLIVIFTTSQKGFWMDYFAAAKEHVRAHQGLNPTMQQNDTGDFREIEGFNISGYQNDVTRRYTAYVEHGNFFVMIQLLFGYKILPWELMLLCCTGILVCMALFYFFQKKKGDFSPEAVMILGYCLFMISDIGVPVYRGHYNVIQWLFPLLLIPVTFQAKHAWLYALIGVAFLLNIHYKPFLPMQHVVGEYLWLATFMVYSLLYKTNQPAEFHRA